MRVYPLTVLLRSTLRIHTCELLKVDIFKRLPNRLQLQRPGLEGALTYRKSSTSGVGRAKLVRKQAIGHDSIQRGKRGSLGPCPP